MEEFILPYSLRYTAHHSGEVKTVTIMNEVDSHVASAIRKQSRSRGIHNQEVSILCSDSIILFIQPRAPAHATMLYVSYASESNLEMPSEMCSEV